MKYYFAANLTFATILLFFLNSTVFAFNSVEISKKAIPAVIGIAKVDFTEVSLNQTSAKTKMQDEKILRIREAIKDFYKGDEHIFQKFKSQNDKLPSGLKVSGSGFFVSNNGLIVTAAHVVEGGSDYFVITHDNKQLPAKLLIKDTRKDLAVLKTESDYVTDFLKLGTASTLEVGENVLAVGNPFGFTFTVTAGIVSALVRHIEPDGIGLIQTDTPLNPGNSGGPILNSNGEVVGVSHAIYNPSSGERGGDSFFIGLGFAVPIDEVKPLLTEIVQ